MMLITTSRMMPQESKKGSWKLRHLTPQPSSRVKCTKVRRTPSRDSRSSFHYLVNQGILNAPDGSLGVAAQNAAIGPIASFYNRWECPPHEKSLDIGVGTNQIRQQGRRFGTTLTS
jgi:hypothetical protein